MCVSLISSIPFIQFIPLPSDGSMLVYAAIPKKVNSISFIPFPSTPPMIHQTGGIHSKKVRSMFDSFLPMQVSIISVYSFHQQMNRGAVAEVTLMSDSTKVIHSFLQEFYLVYLFIYYLLLVARYQQPYDVDHVCT